MIVPMKKTTIIVQEKDAQAALEDLRGLGFLHIEPTQPPQGEDINTLEEKLSLANSCLEILRQVILSRQEPAIDIKVSADWEQKVRHIVDSWKRRQQLLVYERSLLAQIEQWEPWGDFDPQQIQALSQKGIYVSFVLVPLKPMPDFPAAAVVKNIFTRAGLAHCLLISREKLKPGWDEVALPRQGLRAMQERLSETQKTILAIEQERQKFLPMYWESLNYKKYLEHEIEFHQALQGMGRQERLAYISGYAPLDRIGQLERKAKQEHWGLVIREPGEEDNVPVLLRNPRWVALISPLFKFLEILPGYREWDISLPFLIFFSIFFGILIGDAGYGLIYLLASLLFRQKARKNNKDTSLFSFFYILSGCAILWGLFTGTFFGQEWFLKAGFKPLVPALNDQKNLQRLCFFLGALHLSLAHGWRAVLKSPSLTALAELGWLGILWAGFFVARLLILGDSFPAFAKWLVIGGILSVIIFTNPQKNILRTIASGLGTLLLSLMNSFTDVVSYIRLFAVGMAGVAIADAFNAMAGMVGSGNILAILIAALIAIIGNALGIVLGPVSVLVHGVRLNVLEFSSHANISWSGVKYKPLENLQE